MAQTSAPLGRLVTIGGDLWAYSSESTPSLGGTAETIGVIGVNIVLFLLNLYVAILLWGKRRDFQEFFFYQWLAILVWSFAAPVYAAVTVGAPFDNLLDTSSYSELIGTSLWLWYVTKSIRVRNTFVN